jgi:protein-glutamine gamma-glutamyltransferase
VIPPAAAPDSVALRLCAFAALAAVATVEWVALVADPPLWRAALAVAAVLAGVAALAVSQGSGPRRDSGERLAMLSLLAAVVAAMLIIGLPARMLGPGGWGELGDRIGDGLRGLGGGEYPYAGANEWSRLIILLALPLWLGLAGVLLFWPSRRALGPRRLAALAVLVVAYGVGITVNPSGDGAALLRGSILFCAIAAWLWLPALRRPGLPLGLGVVLVAGALALPMAARLDAEEPWLDYHDWRWGVAREDDRSFSWEHSYGPLDWSRSNTPLLEVHSDRSHYWRTLALDHFDGFRWRASGSSTTPAGELPVRPQAGGGALNPHWVEQIGFSVRSLESPFLVGAGAVLDVEGLVGLLTPTANGLLLPEGEPLTEGDSYAISAYVPDPTADRMRRAPPAYPPALARYTTVGVPVDPPGSGPTIRAELGVPLRGTEPSAAVASELAASPYARVYGLARELTAEAPTAFDAAAAIERYLETTYSYDEGPPARAYPLRAFLFRDRIGYCQQFSGAMALMLRMVGIPSRVATGFSPGSPTERRGRYLVTDLDAHSWVEVYFSRIGWVAFDPTPVAAPARSQTLGIGGEALRSAGGELTPAPATEESPAPGPTAGPGSSGGAASLWPLAGAFALLACGVLAAIWVRGRGFRLLAAGSATEALLRELESALAPTRFSASGGATLLSLERRFRSARMPAAAAYVGALRASRFERREARPPGLRQRRALRRELGARGGLGAARRYLALPPGGPFTKS